MKKIVVEESPRKVESRVYLRPDAADYFRQVMHRTGKKLTVVLSEVLETIATNKQVQYGDKNRNRRTPRNAH